MSGAWGARRGQWGPGWARCTDPRCKAKASGATWLKPHETACTFCWCPRAAAPALQEAADTKLQKELRDKNAAEAKEARKKAEAKDVKEANKAVPGNGGGGKEKKELSYAQVVLKEGGFKGSAETKVELDPDVVVIDAEEQSPMEEQTGEKESEHFGNVLNVSQVAALARVGIWELPLRKDVKKRFVCPKKAQVDKTAEQLLMEKLGASPSGSVEEARMSLQMLEKVVVDLAHAPPQLGGHLASMRAARDKAKATLKEEIDKAPAAPCAREHAQKAVVAMEKEIKEKKAATQLRKEESAFQQHTLLLAIDEQASKLAALRAQTIAWHLESEATWQERNDSRAEVAEQALLLMKKRAVEPRDGATTPERTTEAQEPQPSTPQGIHPMTDSCEKQEDQHRVFAAALEDVDKKTAAMAPNSPVIARGLAVLWNFFHAHPKKNIPVITFETLGLEPCHFHTVVGDAVWDGCWDSRSKEISWNHIVPFSLLQILQAILDDHAHPSVRDPSLKEEGKTLFDKAEAEMRRRNRVRMGI